MCDFVRVLPWFAVYRRGCCDFHLFCLKDVFLLFVPRLFVCVCDSFCLFFIVSPSIWTALFMG